MTLAGRVLRNPIGWAFLLIILVLICASVFAIVPETEQAVVVRMGKPDRVLNGYGRAGGIGAGGAGLVARIPLVDSITFIDKRVRALDLTHQAVRFADGDTLDLDAAARYRIVDPLRMYESAGGDEARLEETLKPVFGSALNDALGKLPQGALQDMRDGAALDAVRAALGKAASRYGVQVLDVRIVAARLPEGPPRDAALQQMSAARSRQAADIREDGSKKASAIRADGDAEASRIYADAYGQDPEFYAFYRAMQSYRQTFGVDRQVEGSSVMVLSPDSEYLRYFKTKGK
ncbi:MAG TPA: SPFH domain-containing protein [Sphingomonas sp.]|nr:SPFH domain-containing protein [Sphingomonas sp.]